MADGWIGKRGFWLSEYSKRPLLPHLTHCQVEELAASLSNSVEGVAGNAGNAIGDIGAGAGEAVGSE